jgi:hypothetical protein
MRGRLGLRSDLNLKVRQDKRKRSQVMSEGGDRGLCRVSGCLRHERPFCGRRGLSGQVAGQRKGRIASYLAAIDL